MENKRNIGRLTKEETIALNKQSENFKQSLKERKNKIPEILYVLYSQRELLKIRSEIGRFNIPLNFNIPLHDLIQNLSVWCPELSVKYMLKPCIQVNNYAFSKIAGTNKGIFYRLTMFLWKFSFVRKLHKKLKINPRLFKSALETEILSLQGYRMSELSSFNDSDDVIHSFTEIVDNLQKIVPEKYAELSDAINDYNEAAIAFYEATQQNYEKLTLN
jgi:hypothetical protein